MQFPQTIVALDYILPAEMEPEIGEIVAAPLGKSLRAGVIEAILPAEEADRQTQKKKTAFRYKELSHRFAHLSPLSSAHRKYLHWLAEYYLCGAGAALRLSLTGNPDFYTPPTPVMTYVANSNSNTLPSLTKKQQALLEAITTHQGTLTQQELFRACGCSKAQLKALEEKNLITATPLVEKQHADPSLPVLNPEQQAALETLIPHLQLEKSTVTLLDGETGSGKTEVYFHLIARALEQDKQILVLLPEVSLLVDWQQRFTARFGFSAECWHNAIRAKARRETWHACATGKARVIVGARSALHLCFQKLGLIIVDEEHDLSYKQEDGVCYHARDMAVLRAHLEQIPILLASATPSLESLENVQRKKYAHLRLHSRFNRATLPAISCVDLRQSRPKAGEWLSPVVLDALGDNLAKGQQSLLFLNRRGFSPLVLCRLCGYRLQCPNCSVYLTEHRQPAPHLQCHHCGYQRKFPHNCPQCETQATLSSSGPGTERIIDNLTQYFPRARTFAATADTLSQPQNIAHFLQAMQQNRIDIVVGTQILAKGLDFRNLTLACVLDADQALFGSNPRASEQSWQLLHQIAGRTGRYKIAGRALLQTCNPDDTVFQSLIDMNRDGFLRQQRKFRKNAGLPPFGRLLAIIVQGKNERSTQLYAQKLAGFYPAKHTGNSCHHLLGPLPAPIAKLRGWYRQRLLVIGKEHTLLQPIARHMLQQCPPQKDLRVKVDVDPYSFV